MIAWSHALVTGGAGFIGSHLTRALLADGRRVTVLDNLSVGRRDAVPDGAALRARATFATRPRSNDALAGVDCVFHLAAQVTIRGSFDRFHEDLDTNVMGTARLLRAVDPQQVKWFTLASSMAVYADADVAGADRRIASDAAAVTVRRRQARRGGPVEPDLAARGIPFTAVRFFNTYGPGQTYTPYVGVLTIFITRLLRGEPITIFGDGEQQRDFIHVSDIVAGTVATPGRTPGRYNLGTGRGTSLNQLAALVLASLAPDERPRHADAQAGELRFSVANIDAARRELGFSPSRAIGADLAEVIEWVRAREHI